MIISECKSNSQSNSSTLFGGKFNEVSGEDEKVDRNVFGPRYPVNTK